MQVNEEFSTQRNDLLLPVTRLSDRLIEITELRTLLSYDDIRSVRSWCNKNKIPLLVIGAKTYTVKNFIELHIEGMLKKFVNANYSNTEEIMDAIRNDEEIRPALNTVAVKKEVKKKEVKMSAAAMRFLNEE